MINSTKYEWADVYCHTQFTVWPIIVMVVFLFVICAGLCPLAWVLNAEFYPLWARGTCVAISTFMNGIFNLLDGLHISVPPEVLSNTKS
uniref:Uncharacterized protein n=1 Tax=Acrobeloides nanus TaxID=290746 RepID=A0A914CNP7_9BILA